MQIEMNQLCGYIFNFCNDLKESKSYYEKALNQAEELEDERAINLAICNIGVIEAEKDYDTFLTSLNEDIK